MFRVEVNSKDGAVRHQPSQPPVDESRASTRGLFPVLVFELNCLEGTDVPSHVIAR